MTTSIMILGCGNMGSAIAKGLVKAKRHRDNTLILYDIYPDKARYLAELLNIDWVSEINQLDRPPAYIFVAVKPADFPDAALLLREWHESVFFSVLAGMEIKELTSCLGGTRKIVRLMPNLCVEVGEGVIPTCFSPSINAQEREDILFLLASLGWVFESEEKEIASLTALGGSGPAFIALFVEAMMDAGVYCGLPWEKALKVALQTVLGTVVHLKESGMHPGAFKNAVASPGGTTIAGLLKMEDGGFKASVMHGIDAAYRRASKTTDRE